jgi:hypothetical protein
MAASSGLSHTTVRRIWNAFGLQCRDHPTDSPTVKLFTARDTRWPEVPPILLLPQDSPFHAVPSNAPGRSPLGRSLKNSVKCSSRQLLRPGGISKFRL